MIPAYRMGGGCGLGFLGYLKPGMFTSLEITLIRVTVPVSSQCIRADLTRSERWLHLTWNNSLPWLGVKQIEARRNRALPAGVEPFHMRSNSTLVGPFRGSPSRGFPDTVLRLQLSSAVVA